MDVMIEVPFENQDALEFMIIPETGWDKIKKAFGHLEEIEVGKSDFDAKFLVRGNDEGKIKSLFSKPHIREFLLNQRSLGLQLTPTSLNFYTILYHVYTQLYRIQHILSTTFVFTLVRD